jgi:hypothetical protein
MSERIQLRHNVKIDTSSNNGVRHLKKAQIVLTPSELQQCKLYLRSNPRKRTSTALDALDANVRKHRRSSVELSGTPFPIIFSQHEKDNIVREFRRATDNASLTRYECSFCGKFEKAILITMRAVKDLDISLLERAVVELRVMSGQPRIQSFDGSSVVGGSYILCHLCNSAVSRKKKSFNSLMQLRKWPLDRKGSGTA